MISLRSLSMLCAVDEMCGLCGSSACVQVAAIRQVVAHELGSPYERLKLIKDGKTLEDERNSKPSTVKFVDGGTVCR